MTDGLGLPRLDDAGLVAAKSQTQESVPVIDQIALPAESSWCNI
jgi:hypothetical protein